MARNYSGGRLRSVGGRASEISVTNIAVVVAFWMCLIGYSLHNCLTRVKNCFVDGSILLLLPSVVLLVFIYHNQQQPQRLSVSVSQPIKHYANLIVACQEKLIALERRYGSDKINTHNNFFNTYAKLLCPWKMEEKPISILEFGIGDYENEYKGGADLFTWAQLFPQAEVIVGVDIAQKSFSVPPSVVMIQANQTNETVIAEICEKYGPFDLVVDDASHICEDVIATFKLVWPCLKSESIYILESFLSCNLFSGVQIVCMLMQFRKPSWRLIVYECVFIFGDLNTREVEARVFETGWLSLVNDQNYAELQHFGIPFQPSVYASELAAIHFYHNLVIVEKGDNTYPSNL
ncbi:unnamed protein product [Toxocara canis]|uniref:Class I SAM-dependent methyltransferase n=1 Tax=Toxocara canis TaxID=6265 RepID=A0A183UDP8_TOXCA|nr:unnamed protein product [Toxocara canis]